jgi:hypothetical protein
MAHTDKTKCAALKAELKGQPRPQVISVELFFDGNDDPGSIGCNLNEHPGVGTFRDVLTGLVRRPDVQAVYAQISELDPGEGLWPFADIILAVGTISTAELRDAVSALEPDDVAPGEDFGISPSITERHGLPVLAVWWD